MASTLRIFLFLFLSPAFVWGFRELGTIIIAKINGENRKPCGTFYSIKSISSALDGFKLRALIKNLCPTFYMVFMGLSGSILFYGGNIALTSLTLIFGEAIIIWVRWQGSTPQREISLALFVIDAAQLMVTAIAFYCFSRIILGEGEFAISKIINTGIATAIYLPAMVAGLIWMLLSAGGKGEDECEDDGRNTGGNEGLEIFSEDGMEDFLYKVGGSYGALIVYSALFIINYSGTAFSAVISATICLLVWFLGLFVDKRQMVKKNCVKYLMVSAVILLSSFINLFILF